MLKRVKIIPFSVVFQYQGLYFPLSWSTPPPPGKEWLKILKRMHFLAQNFIAVIQKFHCSDTGWVNADLYLEWFKFFLLNIPPIPNQYYLLKMVMHLTSLSEAGDVIDLEDYNDLFFRCLCRAPVGLCYKATGDVYWTEVDKNLHMLAAIGASAARWLFLF